MEFAGNNHSSYSRVAKHDGTTDWGYDASDIPAQWHGWLHNMNDQVPQNRALATTCEPAMSGCAYRARFARTVKAMDGKAISYEAPHSPNLTGRAGTPRAGRYLPPWHRQSPVVRGLF